MDATERFEFVKSALDKNYKIISYSLELDRVVILFKRKDDGSRMIHYSDLVLGLYQNYDEKYTKESFDRLSKYLRC